jgi:hypothetical protein
MLALESYRKREVRRESILTFACKIAGWVGPYFSPDLVAVLRAVLD